jgi:hypothetical protein
VSDLNLDAVRARYASATLPRSSWSYASASADDVPALIAEIERLREANANLIRNAEILADELVLGTTPEWGGAS